MCLEQLACRAVVTLVRLWIRALNFWVSMTKVGVGSNNIGGLVQEMTVGESADEIMGEGVGGVWAVESGRVLETIVGEGVGEATGDVDNAGIGDMTSKIQGVSGLNN